MQTDDERLNQVLEESGKNTSTRGTRANTVGEQPSNAPSSSNTIEFRQWQIAPNDAFRPAGPSCDKLHAGVYGFSEDNYGLFLQRMKVVSDSLLVLPDSANSRVLEGMTKFWSSHKKYLKHKLLYKRGILLWGPPGSGKTATLQLLSKLLIDQDGIVIVCQNPNLCSAGLQALRRIEPARRLICILEDVDEMINRYGEHQLLALLDGENQVDNIVHIATTNYPELLGARIVNRPSRFDERIFVGMPSPAARREYLMHVAPSLSPATIDLWVVDTDNLSIAHLRELAAAVICLEHPYNDVLARLRSMKQKVSSSESGNLGFVR